jgi:hypothetical protein
MKKEKHLYSKTKYSTVIFHKNPVININLNLPSQHLKADIEGTI